MNSWNKSSSSYNTGQRETVRARKCPWNEEVKKLMVNPSLITNSVTRSINFVLWSIS